MLRESLTKTVCLLMALKVYEGVEHGVNALKLIQMDSFMLKTEADWFSCDFLQSQHIVRCYDFYEHKP